MNCVELLQESIIDIEEIKVEPVDSGDENMNDDSQRCTTVKSELSVSEASVDVLDDSEEEDLKPPRAMFLQLKERSFFSIKEQKDPRAVNANALCSGAVKVEKTEDDLPSPGWRGDCWSAEYRRLLEFPLDDAAEGSSACADSIETKRTSLPCAMCERSVSEENMATHSRGNRHKGSTCTESFSKQKNLEIRTTLATQHNESPNECSGCKYVVAWMQSLIQGPEKCNALLRLYTCPMCSKTFYPKYSTKTRTLKIRTGERPYECQSCAERFMWKSDLVEHMRCHGGVKPNECQSKGILKTLYEYSECKKRFLCKSTSCYVLTSGEKSYECAQCMKKFQTLGGLARHSRILSGFKPFVCAECKESFGSKICLIRHKRIHIGDTPYQCAECKKKFVTKIKLVQHKRIHTGEEPFQCAECRSSFTTKYGLAVHRRIHTGEKPYECAECTKKFRTRSNLLMHMSIHTGKKPYECEKCTKKFRLKCNLVKHMSVHIGKKM